MSVGEKLASDKDVVAIDNGRPFWMNMRNLQTSGMLGTGNTFYKHVLNHLYHPDRVQEVAVTPSKDGGGRDRIGGISAISSRVD